LHNHTAIRQKPVEARMIKRCRMKGRKSRVVQDPGFASSKTNRFREKKQPDRAKNLNTMHRHKSYLLFEGKSRSAISLAISGLRPSSTQHTPAAARAPPARKRWKRHLAVLLVRRISGWKPRPLFISRVLRSRRGPA